MERRRHSTLHVALKEKEYSVMPQVSKHVRQLPYTVSVDHDEFEHGELFGTESWADGEKADKSIEEIIINAANCAARCKDGMSLGKPEFSYFIRRTRAEPLRL
jgi:hypothetical protein